MVTLHTHRFHWFQTKLQQKLCHRTVSSIIAIAIADRRLGCRSVGDSGALYTRRVVPKILTRCLLVVYIFHVFDFHTHTRTHTEVQTTHKTLHWMETMATHCIISNFSRRTSCVSILYFVYFLK